LSVVFSDTCSANKTNTSQGGNNQKWQTPHQKAKATAVATPRGGRIDPGDAGIWATCMKGKEGKATGELMALLEQVSWRLEPPLLPGVVT
jgi:hypothetical protein